jgi:putative phosphoesterase
MRLAIISDLHANFVALKALAEVLEQADCVLCLGDFVGYYCQVNEVIDYVRNLKAICVLGNHDQFLLNGCPSEVNPAVRFGIQFAERVITAENRRWLAALPMVWGGMLDQRSFLLCHGSPWSPLQDYLYADNPAIDQLQTFAYDVIAFGQTHRILQRLTTRPMLLNPGSVGQSRDHIADACAAVVNTKDMTVAMLRNAYDPDPVIKLAFHHGAGEWINKHLR